MKYRIRAVLALVAVLAVAVPWTVATTADAATTFATGDVFVAVGSASVQWRQPNSTLVSTLVDGTGSAFTTGMAFDSAGNLYVTDFAAANVSKFDNQGNLLGTFGSGYGTPESILFDAAGNAYVGDLNQGILKFDSAGNPLQQFSGAGRVDWIDLEPDQCTMLYTNEGATIHRYNVCTDTALSDFTTLGGDFALRILGDGSVLVADEAQIDHFDSAGALLTSYDQPNEDGWFALNLDPDGTSFWSADFNTGDVFRFDIATGNVLSSFNSGTGSQTVFGLSVFGEITASRSTQVNTSLSGGGQSGTAITVPGNTAVTDSATLTGPNVATATGTVTYSVYSDSSCSTAVSTGTAQTITTAGTLPDSSPVSLATAGTYYWQASYSGDSKNAESKSICGDEVETVVTPQPTGLATSLSGGGTSGAQISVGQNTAVTDSATLSGTNAATATGTVTYSVYSDNACHTAVSSGSAQTIVTPGTLPSSAAVSLATPGTYYWQASYSGDSKNVASKSTCGDEIETVFGPRDAGAFLIGDKSAGNLQVGTKVNFWGAQWAKNNALSGGSAPAALKGFTNNPTIPACGVNWSTRPGDSASPPATLPSQILVIVTSKATKSGSTISGNTVHVVLVNVGAGYGPNPGHAGNGTIASTIC